MKTYKCSNPKCDGGLEDLIFNEPMIHRQSISPKTGKVQADEIEASEQEAPCFNCGKCGAVVEGSDDATDDQWFYDLFGQWFLYGQELEANIKDQKQKDKEARQQKAREKKKASLDAQRQEYLKETGFLPPVTKKAKKQ